ncbi:unnamed protein product [Peniophora sp. CBMAI 1063]|nr:unnamed protein product [Peniophora sp. CBMAI 1063]
MPPVVAPERRASLYARVNSNLQPQAARHWRQHCGSPEATSSGSARQTSIPAPKSKGRGGRKIGRAALKLRREEEQLKRSGALARYELYLVRRDCAVDPLLSPSASTTERRLWDELHDIHLLLRETHVPTGSHSINHAYFETIDFRLTDAETAALAVAQTQGITPRTRDKLLHIHRRTLAILYTEQELLTMDAPQSRSIGRDDAFLPCGRRIKHREFNSVFGWWSSEQLLDKYGMTYSDDNGAESAMSSSDEEDSEAASGSGRVSDALIRDLFASDVEDDSDMDN